MCHDFLSPPRAGEGLCGPGDAQCAVELEDVIFCRAVGYGEFVRDLPVACVAFEKLQDPRLTGVQGGEGRFFRRGRFCPRGG